MRLRRTQIISALGVTLLTLFFFQFATTSAMEAGILHCLCNSCQTDGDGSASHGDGKSHSCVCACQGTGLETFIPSPFHFFVYWVAQGNATSADSIPSDGLARLIYSPPRLS